MAAPKGNKFAKGNEGGRPPKFDLKEEAKALKEWADKPDSLVLRLFACVRNYSGQQKIHEYAQMSNEFRDALDYARVKIGARREEYIVKGKGHPAAFQRYAALYDPDLKAHELAMKRADNEGVQIVFIPKRPFDDNDDTHKT